MPENTTSPEAAASSATSGASGGGRGKSLIRQILPWVITFGLLGYLGWAYDLQSVWAAVQAAPMATLLPLWVVAMGIVFVADTACLHSLFRRAGQGTSMRTLYVIKGASYLLNIVNYNAAIGGIAVVLSRRLKRPLLEIVSTVLWLGTVDLVSLALYALVGLTFLDPWPTAVDLGMVPWVAGSFLALYAGALLYWRKGWDFLVLGPLRPLALFHAFRVARTRDHAVMVAQRTGFMGLYFVIHYVSLDLFGIPVPWLELLVYNAVITIVGTLPVSIAGLGTTQLVTIALYQDHGTAEEVLAYSTLITFSFVLLRAVIGQFFIPALTAMTAEQGEESAPGA